MGYRPCRRCTPDKITGVAEERQGFAVSKVKDIITAQVRPGGGPISSLDELAAAVDMSKFHLLRVFKKSTGQTPAQFARNSAEMYHTR